MSKKSENNMLAFAIMFAAVVIAGSLVFFSLQMAGNGVNSNDLRTAINEGIDEYVKNLEQDARAAAEQEVEEVIVVDEDLTDDDAFIGEADAPVTIVEFSDYQCPFCRAFYFNAYEQIKENYIDTGKVKLVFRDFPLSFHGDALPAALATECARDQEGDEAYFEMHDLIFEGQGSPNLGTVAITDDTLEEYAEKMGLNISEFTECVDSEKFADEIFADMADGQRAGVQGTPGLFVNGQFIRGAQPYEVFESAIENALKNS